MKIDALKPMPNYRLWLRFTDGIEATVDLSDKVGRGVFAAWKDPKAFDQVQIGDFGQPLWPGDIDLCPDTLYRTATGHLPSEISAPGEPAHA